ncbi:3-oxoacyl-ACP reductase [Limnohabitans sp. MMS-10A-160]|jgi:NAD(P)-dependent dehydrogenase (short-subunit alcohol dehydrogenase family)|uniref:SDR family NAD(P)-dependent oxidoreductase n=1 Tax=unclassified Limnohabitans TaxID=2626134 RepID=UPI000D3ADFAB|nr:MULTISPECIES: glucose 1-dehydrogenase [unclassified Limnohabitans]PUE20519.1 3-oxoacyl-ACP reductase [Limnohabitans sp. MMS-10A-192]PUE25094.1 3-oxoacyl-ACP reductase [Limnohabitans sp. MMS-10A-160]
MKMPKILKGRTVFITGAGQGNGKAIAIGLADAGAKIVVTDLNRENADVTAEMIRSKGGQAWSYGLDVTSAEQCAETARRVAKDVGAVDVLVNNAGILIREGIDSPNASKNLQLIMRVNVEGTFNVTHAFLSDLRKTKGTIVNVASVASFAGWPNTLGYAPSKGAVKQLTQSLAVDLAKDGVRVNAIAPGVIATAMSASTRADPAKLEKFLTRIPMGRVAEPEELVGAVLFLASPMSSYVTGVTIPIDGGFLAA